MDNQLQSENNKVSYWLEKLHKQRSMNALSETHVLYQSPQEKGLELTEVAINNQKNLSQSTMYNLVKKSNNILLTISSHKFPFDFYPTCINIEETRITIVTREMFSSQVHSIDIKDISNIFINLAPFFLQN